MSGNSAYRKEAWGGCYAGAEGGDLAHPLELGGLDVAVAPLKLDIAVTPDFCHHLHLPAALDLHLITH